MSAGVWLILRQVDGVLRALQHEGYGGYGVEDLGPLSPSGIVAQVEAALIVWNASKTLAHTAFYVYTAIDMVFIALYAGLLYTLIQRFAAPPRTRRWLIATVLADAGENALRIWIVAADSHAPVLVGAAWLATAAKWLTLGAVLLLVAYAWRARRLRDGPSGRTSRLLWALWRLRIPVVVLGAFGLFLIFDPTGQSPDTFRRWFDDDGRFVSALFWTVAGATLLSAVTWTTVRRTVLAGYEVADHGPHATRWALAAAALVGISMALGWVNILALVIVIAIVFALGGLARMLRLGAGYVPLAHEVLDLPARRTQLEDAGAERMLTAEQRLTQLAGPPSVHLLGDIQSVARFVSIWPLLALLLALVSAWTAPPLVLLARGDDTATALACAGGAVIALCLSPFVAFRLPLALRIMDDRGPPQRRELRVLGRAVPWPAGLELRHLLALGACVGLCAAAIAWPLSVPPTIGVVGMLSVGIGALIVGLGEAQRYGETHPPTAGLRMLGFDGLPVVALLALAFTIASTLDDGDYHDVARTTATPPARAGTPLATAFEGWSTRNCAARRARGRMIPMVFIASQGGGIRSAYWTTSVLTELLGAPAANANDPLCARATAYDRVFALNGTSGGSLGISSYTGNATTARAGGRWYRDAWGTTDLASVPTTWGLLVDLPRSLFGWYGPDRARRFEEAFERRDPTLRADFFASQASGPILMHASTQVESGCRMNVAAVRLTVQGSDGRPGDCAALLARPAAGGGTPPDTARPVAALTSDVLDYVCEGGSLRRSTAALMSARFPYVSPSGRLVHCRAAGNEDLEATAVVDGGYAENTAGQAIIDLWARLEPAVAAHNAAGGSRIVPIFVDVDNHYSESVKVGPVARTPQLLVPPLTAGRPDKLDDRGVEQLADARFSVPLPGRPRQLCKVGDMPGQRYVHIAPPNSPGIPAPLAWTLSAMAMDDLDRQRAAAFAATMPAARLRDILRGTPPACSGAR